MKILVLQGPNLNLLGSREPDTYGGATLADLELTLNEEAERLGISLLHYQSNLEGELVTQVQQARGQGVAGALVNAGGFTHSSVALRDSFLATSLPFVEVHISNLYRREAFRQTSLLADISSGIVQGFGTVGYSIALHGLVHTLRAGL